MNKQFQGMYQAASHLNWLIKKYHAKVEVIQVNYSSSFMARSRCKNCGKGPSLYLYTRGPFLYFDPSQKQMTSNMSKKWIKRLSTNWYLSDDPSSFTDVSFSKTSFRDYFVPTLHRTHGNSNGQGNVIEMLCCECGITAWPFRNKAIQNKPEIINRKGRDNYPTKFSW